MSQPRHCLVTGANRGLGLEFVRQLLAAGDHVIATCRHPGRATALNTLTGEHPSRLHVLPLDLAEPRTHAELARELPLVLGADGAVVVNMSSRLGSIASVEGFNTPTYAISKAALNMATVLLARALAERGITVIAVSPGWVRTDMGGKDAPVEPVDSVAGLLAQVERATLADSGRFIDYRGEAIDW